jgi:hypothetical protein
MAKIYVDTNRFLDFYRGAQDKIVMFDELEKYKKALVLTEQTVTEFRRNRSRILDELISAFRNTVKAPPPYYSAVLEVLPGYKELCKINNDYRDKVKVFLEQLKDLVSDDTKDPVAQKFLSLCRDASVIKVKLTEKAIAKAHRRKLLGNPPSSPDKYSVGDEVIWELLLAELKDDLLVVTRDKTFLENVSLLKEEYHQQTRRKLLLITEKFSEALKIIGETPTEELIEAEAEEAQFLDLDDRQLEALPRETVQESPYYAWLKRQGGSWPSKLRGSDLPPPID